jgi:hypothetical protein
MQTCLLNEWQQVDKRTALNVAFLSDGYWKMLIDIVEIMRGETDLSEVVQALDPVGCLAHLLNCGQRQADQDDDDGNHHQQLDQGEPFALTSHRAPLL